MSRRCHHGSPRHVRPTGREHRRGPLVADRPASLSPDAPGESIIGELSEGAAVEVPETTAAAPDHGERAGELAAEDEAEVSSADRFSAKTAEDQHRRGPDPLRAGVRPRTPITPARSAPESAGAPTMRPPAAAAHAAPVPNVPRIAADGAVPGGGGGPDHGATAPQLRRFIKSRAYVPMHELRRRFGINGDDDDVTPVEVDRQLVYVGLPQREGHLVGELLKGGDIGYELSLDPIAPIVVGVYPMRPIPRG